MLRTVRATRYVTPLREGGSLPAIVEADDDGLYVLKFRGAGQGARALISELVAGEIGRRLGLHVPELTLIEVDPLLGRSEPDPEIQDLITQSAGVNLGVDYLPGSLAFDPAVDEPAADLASTIVWFDALITNVDRTARNTNMLIWHQNLWVIDHGAALFMQHRWSETERYSRSPFRQIADHVLLPFASRLQEIGTSLAARLDRPTLEQIVSWIPDLWLVDPSPFGDRATYRAALVDYLATRLDPPFPFLQEAEDARARLL